MVRPLADTGDVEGFCEYPRYIHTWASERPFGPNLRRIRVQRGISSDQIAGATKVSQDLWSGLGTKRLLLVGRRASAPAPTSRAYAMQLGVDAETTVDDFCRFFPQGDRRVARVDPRAGRARRTSVDVEGRSFTGQVPRNRRAERRPGRSAAARARIHARTGRIIAALGRHLRGDGRHRGRHFEHALPVGKAGSIAAAALCLSRRLARRARLSCRRCGCSTPISRTGTPPTHRATQPRFLRPLRGSRTWRPIGIRDLGFGN